MREDASDHGGGEAIILPLEQHPQLVFARARVLTPQGQEALGRRGGPGGLTHTMWAVGTLFQPARIVPVETPPPAIKGLSADAEMPAGKRDVASVVEIKKHPTKPRRRRGLNFFIPSVLAHPDTLPSVTNHSERAQEPAPDPVALSNQRPLPFLGSAASRSYACLNSRASAQIAPGAVLVSG